MRTLRSAAAIVAFATGLAVATVALVWLALTRGGLGGDPASIRSIAVLPIVNLSGNAEREYVADGMTDAPRSDASCTPPPTTHTRTLANVNTSHTYTSSTDS